MNLNEAKRLEALIKSNNDLVLDRELADSGVDPAVRAHIQSLRFAKKKDFQSAISVLERICKGNVSRLPRILATNLLSFYTEAGQYKQAAKQGELLFKQFPNDRNLAVAYASALLDTARSDETIKILEPFFKDDESYRRVALPYCAALRASARHDEALHIIESFLRRNPKDHAFLRLLGDLYGEVDSSRAISYYAQAAALNPGNHIIRWNMSLHLLRTGEWKKGWEYYESGIHPSVGTMGRNLPPLLRRSLPVDLYIAMSSGKFTLLVAEQGIGDQIIFASVLDEALKLIPNAILACEPRMRPIFATSFPSIPIADPGFIEIIGQNPQHICGYIPLGSLMQYFRNDSKSFIANRRSYLGFDKQRSREFRALIIKKLGLKDRRPLVGISWRGGFWQNQKSMKTLEFTDWIEMMRSKDAIFLNLQYGDTTSEQRLASEFGVKLISIPEIDFTKDLKSWLELACCTDGIITVSTALAHFAGAAGQKVGVLLPKSLGPFIWGLNEGRSLIYPNTYVFRKQATESNIDLMRRIGEVIG
jgi:tetratricopeptide (TPR) repeat protein